VAGGAGTVFECTERFIRGGFAAMVRLHLSDAYLSNLGKVAIGK
jgi:hypothetical protein